MNGEKTGRRMHRVPDGTTLAIELQNAMERVEALGIRFPPGYADIIKARYTIENVPYPYIVMQIGQARIRRHFLYPVIIRNPGILLDYGCGTGDAIRQLIRDGYPAKNITGFDVSDASLRIGYDLYLDRHEMEPRVLVAPSYNCDPEKFDYVYSGSVIHVLGDEEEFNDYLDRAHRTLRTGGSFFGSTLGFPDMVTRHSDQGPPRLMRRVELLEAMERAGFIDIRIQIEERPELAHSGLGFCLYQFRAGKGGK